MKIFLLHISLVIFLLWISYSDGRLMKSVLLFVSYCDLLIAISSWRSYSCVSYSDVLLAFLVKRFSYEDFEYCFLIVIFVLPFSCWIRLITITIFLWRYSYCVHCFLMMILLLFFLSWRSSYEDLIIALFLLLSCIR